MAAATFSAAGRRLLSTAATAVEKTELPVPIAQLRRLARTGRLADIDAALAPLLPTHTVAALSALSSVGLPDRASALLGTVASPTAEHLNAVLGPLLRRRRLAGLVPSILQAHTSVPRDASTDRILAKSLCLTSGADSALHLLREPASGAPPSVQLFAALIDSFYKQRLPHRAEELWRAMVQDHGIAPDAAAYNARITYKPPRGGPWRLSGMAGWRVAGARAVLRRLSAASETAGSRDGGVLAAICSSSSRNAPSGLGQYVNLFRAQAFTSRSIPVNFHQLIRNAGISTTRNLLADDAMVPISSPLTPPLGDGEETGKKGAVVKRLKVQAIKKDIKQSPKKVNLVAKLVRGMRVEDALLQLQVTVKRAAKTVYQVIHSARANAAHNHGLDPDKLIVEEAFVGKGLYLKRLSYHAKGRCGIMVRPRCRLTVVVREATAEEEAKIAKLRVSNYKKLTRKERQLMPHRLIEVSPRWARKRKEEAGATA